MKLGEKSTVNQYLVAIVGAVAGAFVTIGGTVIYSYYSVKSENQPAVLRYYSEQLPVLSNKTTNGDSSPTITINENSYGNLLCIRIRLFNPTPESFEELSLLLNIKPKDNVTIVPALSPSISGPFDRVSNVEEVNSFVNSSGFWELEYKVSGVKPSSEPIFSAEYYFPGDGEYEINLVSPADEFEIEPIFIGNLSLERLAEKDSGEVPFRIVLFGMAFGILMSAAVFFIFRRLSGVEKEIDVSEIENAITLGYSALGASTSDFVINDAISKLMCVLREHPTNRRAAMVLGRLHRRLNNLDRAIEVLTDTLTARRNDKIYLNQDDADLMYNRACYYTRWAEKSDDAAERDKLLRSAIDDLRESIRISPANAKDIANDPTNDFIFLSDNDEFKQLIG